MKYRYMFHSFDNDNQRVYYTSGNSYFCFQYRHDKSLGFFICTDQGEPLHEIVGDCADMQKPPGMYLLEVQVRELIDKAQCTWEE